MATALAPLVGRDRHLGLLRQWLDDAVAGHGSAVLLSGEAGIGKTRLAEELGAQATGDGVTVAWATSWEGDGVPPLWPWAGILRGLVGDAGALERAAPVGHDDAEAARFAQFEAVAEVVLRACEVAPVVVVIDDLHWADLASIRLFGFLAANLRPARCLLVGTIRPDETSSEAKELLTRHGSVLPLTGLDEHAVIAMVAGAVGDGDPVPLARTVLDRSGGNPLFALELTRLLAASGRFDLAGSAVPERVQQVIERRLARVAESDLPVLRCLALLGRAAALDDARRVVGVEQRVIDRIADAATKLGVLEPTAAGEVRFTHDLVRQVVLESIPATGRADLHLRVAEVYEQRVALDASWHAVAADHLDAAGGKHRVRAARHWEAAGERATDVLAYEEAARCYNRAVGASVGDPGERLRLLLREAESLLHAGNLRVARERFADASQMALVLDDPIRLAMATFGATESAAGWEVPLSDPEHVALLNTAIDRLPAGEPRLRALLLARASVASYSPQTVDTSVDLADRALAVATELGDGLVIAAALAAVNDAHGGPDFVELRHANATKMVELATAAGDAAMTLLGRRFLLVCHAERGDFVAFERQVVLFERDAASLRQPLVSWYPVLFRGMRALMRGELDVTRAAVAEVERFATSTGSQDAQLLAMTLTIGLGAVVGDMPSFDVAGILGIEASMWPSLAAGLAMVAVLRGDRDAAAEHLGSHAPGGFGAVNRDAEYLTTLTGFARAAAFVGDRTSAAALAERLAPFHDLWVIDGIGAVCWGPVDGEIGRLYAFLGDRRLATEHLERARDLLVAAGAPTLLADVERVLGAEPTRLAPPTGTPDGTDRFMRDGELWTLCFDGQTVRLRHAKGLQDLARLVAAPGREVHAAELAGGRVVSAGLGDVLDPRARAEYRERLRDLDEELAEAEAFADLARAERARTERDFLVAELTGAVGLHGRARKAGDPDERARKAVSLRIRQAIDRITAVHPGLGRHLTNSVRTGLYCSYQPETARLWKT